MSVDIGVGDCVTDSAGVSDGVAVRIGQAQICAQASLAVSTQNSFHGLVQQSESSPQTQVSQRALSHPEAPCMLQQTPPGVTTSVGVRTSDGHGQLAAHVVAASIEQKSFHSKLQQLESRAQTQALHIASSQSRPACGLQQSPPGVGAGVVVGVGESPPQGQDIPARIAAKVIASAHTGLTRLVIAPEASMLATTISARGRSWRLRRGYWRRER